MSVEELDKDVAFTRIRPDNRMDHFSKELKKHIVGCVENVEAPIGPESAIIPVVVVHAMLPHVRSHVGKFVRPVVSRRKRLEVEHPRKKRHLVEPSGRIQPGECEFVGNIPTVQDLTAAYVVEVRFGEVRYGKVSRRALGSGPKDRVQRASSRKLKTSGSSETWYRARLGPRDRRPLTWRIALAFFRAMPTRVADWIMRLVSGLNRRQLPAPIQHS